MDGCEDEVKTFFFSCRSKRRMRNRIHFLLLEFFRKHQTTRNGKKESLMVFLVNGRNLFSPAGASSLATLGSISLPSNASLKRMTTLSHMYRVVKLTLRQIFRTWNQLFLTHTHTHLLAHVSMIIMPHMHHAVIFSLAALLRIHSPRFNYN